MSTIIEIEPAYRDALQSAGLSDFDAFMRVRGGSPASRHRHRETIPLTVSTLPDDGECFLKRVFRVPPKHAIIPLLRLRRGQSQPAREWAVLDELRAAGIPAMHRVAYGERRRFGIPRCGFLLVRKVPIERTIEDWLRAGFPTPPALSDRLRKRLLYETGRLIGQVHAAGYRWSDAQAKHIFAAPAVDVEGEWPHAWTLRLIDVERMRRSPPSRNQGDQRPARDVFRDLCRLSSSLEPAKLRAEDVSRFAAGYRKSFESSESAGAVSCDPAYFRDRLKRIPRLPNDYVHPNVNPPVNRRGMCIDPAHEPWLTAAGLTDIDAVFRYSIGKKLDKPGLESFRERGRITLIDKSGRPRTYFMKRYIHPPMSQQIRRIREAGSARTTAEREAHFARKLATFGVPAVRMAAFGGEHRGWREFRSFSIAEAIDGVSLETLAQQLERGDAMALSAPDRHEMIRQIARITSAMHRQLLFHRDLYLCHVFLTHNDDGAIVLQLIDLARMIGRPWLRRRWVAKDLASLDYSSPRGVVTRTDRFRFLRDYYAYVWNSSTPAIRRAFLRGAMLTIASRRNRIARHDAKRLRRLGATSVKPDVAPRDFARQT